MVATCLVKDPKKRPSSEKLLKHPFFKHARSVDYLARTILDGLDPLGERFKKLKVSLLISGLSSTSFDYFQKGIDSLFNGSSCLIFFTGKGG